MTPRADAAATRSILIAVAVSLAFCSVVFVLWLGAHDVLAGRMSAGLLSQFVLFAVLARDLARRIVASLERSCGRRRRRGPHRRAARGRSRTIVAPRDAGRHAHAAAGRDRIRSCRLRL